MSQLGMVYAVGAIAPEKRDITRDLVSAGAALAVPIGYHYGAPKKWRRFGLLGNLVMVVGTYFGTSWAYGKLVNRKAVEPVPTGGGSTT
jgi:hypothetical protein